MNDVFLMDCLEGMKNIPDKSVDFILTDPPYDVNYGEKSSVLARLDKAREKQIERDESFQDVAPDYNSVSAELYRVLKDNSHVYLFCGGRQLPKWMESMHSAGFKEPQILTWKKNITTFDITFGHFFPFNSEFILFFQKGWKRLNVENVDRTRFKSVLTFNSSRDTGYHSCAKPINLLMFLTRLSSNEGDVCLDPFSGSGNHLIAFKRCKRRYIGFEVSSVYHATILRRLKAEETQKTVEFYEKL